jgi:uncharacterized protein
MTPEDANERLTRVLAGHGSVAVAVSGGVDSMTLASVAHRATDAEMIHAVSPAVPGEATERVRAYASRFGWRLTVADAGEFNDPRYTTNPANRCYFCKTNLYDRLAVLTSRRIASGANLDDLGDYRPGLLAADEHAVVHPLIEAGIDKSTVRALARFHGLDDVSELPAQPCLSSRVETGIAIDPRDLAFVHAVEVAVRRLEPSLENVRCRVMHDGIQLETDPVDEIRRVAVEQLVFQMTADASRRWKGWMPYRRGAAFHVPPAARLPSAPGR